LYICVYITVFSKLYGILIKGFTFFSALPKAPTGTVNYGMAGVFVRLKKGNIATKVRKIKYMLGVGGSIYFSFCYIYHLLWH